MKVSIIVPVYNTQDYLPECLQSLVDQTLSDVEIIVVNDGSTDGSQAIIDDFSRDYPGKIRAFIKENGGLSEARNFGLDRCRGEYVGFVDSDDLVASSMFEDMYGEATSRNADIVVCAMTFLYEQRHRCTYFPDDVSFSESVVESPNILLLGGSYANNKIFRRVMLSERAFRFPVGQYFEDSAVVYNIMLDSVGIAVVNKPLYLYRKSREGSITSTADVHIFDVLHSCRSILDHYRKHPDYQVLHPYVASLCVKHILARIRGLWDSRDRRLAFSFVDEALAFLDGEFSDWKSAEYFSFQKKSKMDAILSNLVMRGIGIKLFLAVPLSIRKTARQEFRRAKKAMEKLRRIIRGKRESAGPSGSSLAPGVLDRVAAIGESLDARNIMNFLDFGTLLGVVRDGRLIAHDKDIDIGVLNGACHVEIRQVMADHGLYIWRQYLLRGRIVEESYKDGNIKIDVAYYDQGGGSSSTWLFYRKPGIRYKNNQRSVVEMRYQPIGPVIKKNVAGVTVNVPSNAEAILKEKYGPDWRRPDPSWIYWKSPAAIAGDCMGQYIQFEHVTGETWRPSASVFGESTSQ